MYKILGVDGKEYGPVNSEQLKLWVAQGRVHRQTKVRSEGSAAWRSAVEFPELQGLFAPPGPPPLPPLMPPPLAPPRPSETRRQGLAIASLVLGISSIALCLSIVTGIPAIISGHIAYHRARKAPATYRGSGMALAGLLLGYLSVLLAFILAATILPAARQAQVNHQTDACMNNLKQMGLAFRVWAIDHSDQFPFNVSTNNGGSLELCAPEKDGFDRNAIAHFRIIEDELGPVRLLVCPNDPKKRAAKGYSALAAENLTYRLRCGPNVNDTNPTEVLAVCPVHGYVLHCDGSVSTDNSYRGTDK